MRSDLTEEVEREPSDPSINEEKPDSLFAMEWRPPWHAYVLPLALAAVLFLLWLLSIPAERANGWAVSWRAIRSGHIEVLVLHMFAHGGLLHVAMNAIALVFISAPLMMRLGRPPISWARYLYLFIGSGLAGAALFLLLNRDEPASMLGASGGVFGLLGAFARMHPVTGELVALKSRRTWLLAKGFVQDHALLFVLLAAYTLFVGETGGIAWEAHLGGLVFGLLTASIFLPTQIRPAR